MNGQTTIRNAKHVTVSLLLLGGAVISVIASGGCRTASTTGPQPPSGGQRYVMDYTVFATEIDSILTNLGCDNIACHGGGIRGTFELSPSTNKDIDLDFAQASLQVTPADLASSPLLTKPLDEAGGGVAHAAQNSGFSSTSDPDYQAILAWINAGEYQ